MTPAEAMAKAGWRVARRKCSNPTIRLVNLSDTVQDVPVYEVRCGCGFAGFNAAGMQNVYERHRAQAALDEQR